MMYFLKLLIIILLFNLTGCAWVNTWFHFGDPKEAKVIPFVESGKIVNAKRLAEGGKMLLVPFSAGPGVEASEELDNLSLIMVRGLSDVLGREDNDFELMINESQSKADFILDGFITSKLEPSAMKKLILRKKTKTFSVEGKLIDARTNHTIVIFTEVESSKDAGVTHTDLAIKIGQDIAKFILTGLN